MWAGEPAGYAPPVLLLLAGCALHAHVTGLVLPDTDPVELRAPQGKEYHLRLDAESDPIRYLHDCIVVVEGPRVGGKVLVRDWYVQDAGDGSGGFVGILRVYGARLVIDDRNTQTTLLIDDEAAGQLRAWVGRPVLLMGHVSGGNTVMPMAWRLLADE